MMKLSKVRRASSGAPPSSADSERSSGREAEGTFMSPGCIGLGTGAPEARADRLADAAHRSGVPPEARAHADADPFHGSRLGLVDRQHAIRVMRLDPALQEPGRHREASAAVDHRLQFEPAEPACEHVLAKFDPQAPLDARPGLESRLHVQRVRAALVGGGMDAVLLAAAIHECPLCAVLPPTRQGPVYATVSPDPSRQSDPVGRSGSDAPSFRKIFMFATLYRRQSTSSCFTVLKSSQEKPLL